MFEGEKMIYYTYILRCRDNSLYTGMAKDLNKRMEEHFFVKKRGARYTKMHQVTSVAAVWTCSSRDLACKLETRIKRLTKTAKEDLIVKNNLEFYFGDKLDCKEFKRANLLDVLEIRFLFDRD